jgi:phosphogluconate dehydratase
MSATSLHSTIREVTERISARSRETRADYLARMAEARAQGRTRGHLTCGGLAHGIAAAPDADKAQIRAAGAINLGIVTAYNDMLSAHQPLATYPELIKTAARLEGCTAQVAGGVPAMCDGVTQGRPGMELSLFSRDVIALATAVALSHEMFEAALCLGTCDKIVPGLVMGALAFGHLPLVMVPAGPMTSGCPNKEMAQAREHFAQGKIDREALLEVESRSFHGPGTCTFFGTANSNQMLMEVMGLHVPGTAFVNAGTSLRGALTHAAAQRAIAMVRAQHGGSCQIVDERAIVNGIVGLMATGGSTNHALHLPAIARAAGILVNWDDFADISRVTPLMARIYPNGSADVNHFHAAGGMGFLIRELLRVGLLHHKTETVAGSGLEAYAEEPWLKDGVLAWRAPPPKSLDTEVLRSPEDPFAHHGGLRVLKGNLGRAVIKISAVAPEHRAVTAPAAIFEDKASVLAAFRRGELDRDVIVVMRYQGPKANGMPELHHLTPLLGSLINRGFKVALVTDGRLSGASGKVAAAIHVTPEAFDSGALGLLRDGDIVCLDAERGILEAQVDADKLRARAATRNRAPTYGMGRELFANFRRWVGSAETGASVLGSGGEVLSDTVPSAALDRVLERQPAPADNYSG